MLRTPARRIAGLVVLLTTALGPAGALFAQDNKEPEPKPPHAGLILHHDPAQPGHEARTMELKFDLAKPPGDVAPPVKKPKLPAPADLATWEKWLRQACDSAVAVLSGNQPRILSENKTDLLSGNAPKLLSGNSPELLSGNSPELLSGNSPELLSGNKPKLFSGNQTPILSGNRLTLFSDIKFEIKISESGNHNGNENGNHNGNSLPPMIGPGAKAIPPQGRMLGLGILGGAAKLPPAWSKPSPAKPKAPAAKKEAKPERSKKERTKKEFSKLDANGDGSLSLEEYLGVASPADAEVARR